MTLIVIPARGGSVGIPHKAVTPLGGVPPIVRTIRTAERIGADIVVITDDEHIAALASPVRVLRQPSDLNPEGRGSLDAVVAYAVRYMERIDYPDTYDTIVTLQCTSPFTRPETIREALRISREMDTTVLTVRDDRALRWESAQPNTLLLSSRAPRRVIRQRMPPVWRETGAVFVTPRRWVEPTSRFAHTAYLLAVSGKEAVDLDTMEDWWIAERYAAEDVQECAA